MSNVALVVSQSVPATAELLNTELKKAGLLVYPINVLKAYLERFEEWEEPVNLTPQKVSQEIVASPYSYCKVNEMYLFEGNYFPTVDAITDHVIDNSYGLITDEASQIVYYIAY